MTGSIDGRYQILQELGSGGSGTVYRVEDRVSGEIRALKVLAYGAERQRERLLRFRREFRASATLSHPNIVKVFDFVAGRPSYFTMEYIDGKDVATYFGVGRRGARPEELNQPRRIGRLFAVLHQITLALEYIRQHQIVHRDLKPDNLLVVDAAAAGGTAPLVKIMDFGLARDLRDTTNLTQPGVVLGTLAYVSPEQATGLPIDGRADFYALGVILYRLLTGSLPYTTDAVSSILWKHCSQPPEPPHVRNLGVNRPLESICLRLLKKDPFERYQTAPDLLRAIARASRGLYVLPDVITSRPPEAQSEEIRGFASRLVGRAAELDLLRAAVERARDGAGSVFLITGPNGSGRSRLLTELAAVEMDTRVVRGRFLSDDPRPAAGLQDPAARLAEWVLGLSAVEARAVAGNDWSLLVGTFPALANTMPSGIARTPSPPVVGDTARESRLASAFVALVVGLAQREPLVLAIDDVDCADRLGRAVIQALLQVVAETRVGASGPRLMLVLTGSAMGADDLAGLAAAGQISLGPLGLAHITLLTQSILGDDVRLDGCVEVLESLSGGNPGLAEELIRVLLAERILGRHEGRLQVNPVRLQLLHDELRESDSAVDPRATARHIFRRRLRPLAPGPREVLQTAALYGRDAGFDLLVAATGLAENDAIDAVDVLLRGAFLVEGRADSSLRVATGLLRDAVLQEIDDGPRPHLARRLLEAIVRCQGEGDLETLAHLAQLANDRERALDYRTRELARRVAR